MDHKTQNKEFNETIRKLFHGASTMEKAAAASHLGYLKDKRAMNSLVKALESEEDPIIINRIIEAMGQLKDPRATMIIVELLKNELETPENLQDKQRIFLIIESLMKIGDSRALEHLGILLDSCDADIKQLTEKAFECIDPSWKDKIRN